MRLPHLADIMRLEETEKIQKFIRLMDAEIARRKKLMSDNGVASLAMYSQLTGYLVPSIVIALDSFEAMKDESFEQEMFKLLTKLSREGLAIGIHLLVTAGRQSNLRATFYGNFKHQLALIQNDKSDVRSVVGSTPLAEMDDIKGRALMRREEVDVVQLVLPNHASSDIEMIEKLRKEVEEMSRYYQGKRPQGIPMVPEHLTAEDFYSRPSVKEAILSKEEVPVGLEIEDVISWNWSLSKGNLLYVYDQESKKRATLPVLMETLIRKNFQVTCISASELLEINKNIRIVH